MMRETLAAPQPQPRRSRVRLPPREILGVTVAPLLWDEALGAIRRFVLQGVFTRVGFLNAHGSNLIEEDPAYAETLGKFLILPDGIGVDIASKLLHGSPFPCNLNGTDFVPALLRSIDRPLRVGLIGTKLENAEGAASALERLAPQHDYWVISDGFFSDKEEPAVLRRLAIVRPDILLVAMGMPRQEFWIAEKITPEHCTVPIAVGALLDFLSGTVPRAPAVFQKLRLEWLFRMLVEPRRLWRRYLLGNPVFLSRVLRRRLKGEAASECA